MKKIFDADFKRIVPIMIILDVIYAFISFLILNIINQLPLLPDICYIIIIIFVPLCYSFVKDRIVFKSLKNLKLSIYNFFIFQLFAVFGPLIINFIILYFFIISISKEIFILLAMLLIFVFIIVVNIPFYFLYKNHEIVNKSEALGMLVIGISLFILWLLGKETLNVLSIFIPLLFLNIIGEFDKRVSNEYDKTTKFSKYTYNISASFLFSFFIFYILLTLIPVISFEDIVNSENISDVNTYTNAFFYFILIFLISLASGYLLSNFITKKRLKSFTVPDKGYFVKKDDSEKGSEEYKKLSAQISALEKQIIQSNKPTNRTNFSRKFKQSHRKKH